MFIPGKANGLPGVQYTDEICTPAYCSLFWENQTDICVCARVTINRDKNGIQV